MEEKDGWGQAELQDQWEDVFGSAGVVLGVKLAP